MRYDLNDYSGKIEKVLKTILSLFSQENYIVDNIDYLELFDFSLNILFQKHTLSVMVNFSTHPTLNTMLTSECKKIRHLLDCYVAFQRKAITKP